MFISSTPLKSNVTLPLNIDGWKMTFPFKWSVLKGQLVALVELSEALTAAKGGNEVQPGR